MSSKKKPYVCLSHVGWTTEQVEDWLLHTRRLGGLGELARVEDSDMLYPLGLCKRNVIRLESSARLTGGSDSGWVNRGVLSFAGVLSDPFDRFKLLLIRGLAATTGCAIGYREKSMRSNFKQRLLEPSSVSLAGCVVHCQPEVRRDTRHCFEDSPPLPQTKTGSFVPGFGLMGP
jgi:hypothetical protein